ncbi:uncharacterized protein LOC62_07G009698 [Vanrija pseudolonga]|uniref:Uncharacterized protein n=1 Tax=Vanrija pseudolonga TaxID=143232 RepID=A0AAF0YG96_9TREE|nr:hypothetical protein LOC62_07G009698 [Vanrija pseudolonga]
MRSDSDDNTVGRWCSMLACVGVGAALVLVVHAVPVGTLQAFWIAAQLVQAGVITLWAAYVFLRPDRRLMALYAPLRAATPPPPPPPRPPLANFIAVRRRDYRLAQARGLMFFWAAHTVIVAALHMLTGLVLLPAYISAMLLITMVLSPSSPVTSRHGPSAAMLLARVAGCTASFAPRAAFGDGDPLPEDEMVRLVIAHAQAELAYEDEDKDKDDITSNNPAAAQLSAALATLITAAASRDHKDQLNRPVEDVFAALDRLAPALAAPEPRAGAKCPLALLRRGRAGDVHDLEKGKAGQGT